MDLLDAHGAAMHEFDRRVQLIADGQWTNPTPDTEWSVRDLVEHLVGEQLWVPLLLGGATVEQVGDRFDGDNLGDDPKTAWSLAITGRGTRGWRPVPPNAPCTCRSATPRQPNTAGR
jgi:hypothetical protein